MGVAPFVLDDRRNRPRRATGEALRARHGPRGAGACMGRLHAALSRALRPRAGLRSFRGTTKFIFLAALFMAMLAAVGSRRAAAIGRRRCAGSASASLGAGGARCSGSDASRRRLSRRGSALWLPALGRQFFPDAYQMFVIDGGPSSTIARSATASSFLVGGATFALVGSILLREPPFSPAPLRAGAPRSARGDDLRALRPAVLRPRRRVPRRSAALRAALDARQAGDARVASRDPYSYAAMGAGAYDLWGAEPAVLGRYTEFVKLTQGWPLDALLVAPGFGSCTRCSACCGCAISWTSRTSGRSSSQHASRSCRVPSRCRAGG